MASLRWEVLGCTPLPHRTEKSSDHKGEEPLPQAVSTQLLQPQVPSRKGLPRKERPPRTAETRWRGRVPTCAPSGLLAPQQSTSPDKFHGLWKAI